MRFDSITMRLIDLALCEDLGARGDLSTRHFLPAGQWFKGSIVAKHDGVLCGTKIAQEVFKRICPRARIQWLKRDGAAVRKGDTIARLSGTREILTAERTALNFLQQLSGISTLTRAFVDQARGQTRIYDTRKTIPGWRALAKYAVRCGGGHNHRQGLYDMVLLKDNHLAASKQIALKARVAGFRARYPKIPIEVEAKTRAEVQTALALGADIILLDNMSLGKLKREMDFLRRKSPRAQIEISGGVNLKNVGKLARLKPDRISVGRITHSAPALDMSLELE